MSKSFEEVTGDTFVPFNQIKEEICNLYDEVRSIKPQTILEIGVQHGGTFYLWCSLIEEGLVIGVDIDVAVFEKVSKLNLQERFPNVRQEIIIGNSSAETTISKVEKSLNAGKVDFLFIDGDHKYDAVKQDYLNYSKFVREGGLIAFHDINYKNNSVDRFWRELEYQGKREIIHDYSRNGFGIGLIRK